MRHIVQINTFSQFHFLGIDLKDRFTTREIWAVDQHLAIEATGTQQGSIKNFWLVGGRKNNDGLVLGRETIHFREQLVERLFTLVVPTNNAHGARTTLTDGIKFIDKDDARGLFLGLFEQVTDASSTRTNEKFYKFRAGNNEEGNLCFASHRLGEQCFAGSRRAD